MNISKIRKRARLLLLTVMATVAAQAFAAAPVGTCFFDGGFKYRIISDNEARLEYITQDSEDPSIEIDRLIIPDEIKYDGDTYLVTEVGYAYDWGGHLFRFTSFPYIEIGKNVRKFDSSVLTSRAIIVAHGEIPPVIEGNNTGYGSILYADYADAYKNAPVWSGMIYPDNFKVGRMPDNLAYTIDTNGCTVEIESKNSGMTGDVVIPEIVEIDDKKYTVVKIGSFGNDQSLTSIELPVTITEIDNYIFKNCKNLQSAIGENIIIVSTEAFHNDNNLKSVKFSEKGCRFGLMAMKDCANLTEVSPIQFVEEEAFWGTSIKLTKEDCLTIRYLRHNGLPATAYPSNLHLRNVYLCGEILMENIESIICENVSFEMMPDGYGGYHPGYIRFIGNYPRWIYADISNVNSEYLAAPFVGGSEDYNLWNPYIERDDDKTCKMCMSYAYYSDEDIDRIYKWLYENEGSGMAGAWMFYNEYISSHHAALSSGNRIKQIENGIVSYATNYYGVKRLEFVSPDVTSIDIEPETEEIGDYALSFCKNIKSVILPDNLKSIGFRAFSDCSSLTNIKFSGSIEIDVEAFSNTALKSIHFPNGASFVSSNHLHRMGYFPELERISNIHGAFVVTGPKLKSIAIGRGYFFFADQCKQFKKIGVREGSDYYFRNYCNDYCSESYDSTGEKTLLIYYPDDAIIDESYVYSPDRQKLYFAHAGLDEMEIPANVKEIHTTALQACDHSYRLNIQNAKDVLMFPEKALLGTVIDSLYIDRAISYGGTDGLFNTLKHIEVGENVKSIGENLFNGSKELKTIRLTTAEAPVLSATAFTPEQYETVRIIIDCDSIDSYLATSNNWRKFKSLLDNVDVAAATDRIDNFKIRLTENDDYEIVGVVNAELVTNLVIPDKFKGNDPEASDYRNVSAISAKAFAECKELSTLTLPATIKEIGLMAFANCTNLTTISGGENVEIVRGAAFQNCTKLRTANLPNVSVIGAAAFEGCSALSSMSFGANLSEIGDRAFYGSGLTSADFASAVNLRRIGNDAFYQSRIRGTLALPDSLEHIGDRAFAYARMITSLKLPENSKLEVGDAAFSTCERLTDIQFPQKMKSMGNNAFEKSLICRLSTDVETLGDDVFMSSSNLTYVALGNSLRAMGRRVFFDSPVATFTINPSNTDEALVDIMDDCFNNEANNHYLTYVSLGNLVRSIGDNALKVDGSLNLGTSVQTIGAGCDFRTDDTLELPASLTDYRGTILNVGLLSIPYSENTLHLSNSLTAKEAFIDRKIECDQYYMFTNNSLPGLVYGDTKAAEIEVRNICSWGTIPSIHFGASVKSISNIRTDYATFSEGIETLTDNALTTMQAELRLPASLTRIEPRAITCNGLKELIFADGAEPLTIAKDALTGLDGLTSVYVGRNFVAPKDGEMMTFFGNAGLSKACFGTKVTRVPDNMFSGCTNLTNVITPDNITEIGARAYYNCSKLNVLSISANVTSIGDEAYRGCTGLSRIVARGITPPYGNAGFGAAVEDNVPLYVPEASLNDYMASDLFYAFFNIFTHNENIAASVTGDVDLREAEAGQTINLMEKYDIYVDMVGGGASMAPVRKSRKAPAKSDNLSHTFYWFSTNPTAASVTQDGILTIHTTAAAEVCAAVLDGSDEMLRIGINNIVAGDSNDDGTVTVTDAVNTANYAVGNEVNNFFFRAADVNKDEKITLSDASGTIKIVLTQPYARNMAARAPRLGMAETPAHLNISDYSARRDETARVGIRLHSDIGLVALQADVCVPEGTEIVAVTSGRGADGHSVSTYRMDERTMRVVLFDPSSSTFDSNDEVLVNLEVRVNEVKPGAIEMSNIFASDADANEYRLTASGGLNLASTSGAAEMESGSDITIAAEGHAVVVNNACGRQVVICRVDGSVVADFVAQDETERFEAATGFYIVKVADKVEKLIIK